MMELQTIIAIGTSLFCGMWALRYFYRECTAEKGCAGCDGACSSRKEAASPLLQIDAEERVNR